MNIIKTITTLAIVAAALLGIGCSSSRDDRVASFREALTTLMLGDTSTYSYVDTTFAGQVEAWRYQPVNTANQANRATFCFASSSSSTKTIVGLYNTNSNNTKPSTFIAKATITTPTPGTCQTVVFPNTSLDPTKKYWLAALSPKTFGNLQYPAAPGTLSNHVSCWSSSTTLTDLPATYPSSSCANGWSTDIALSYDDGQGGAGGAPGAGGASSGGAASGGSPGAGGATGGSPGAGGTASGGSSSGGAASGGAAGATGGTSSGGADAGGSGGTATGGAAGSGGTSGSAYVRQYAQNAWVGNGVQDITATLPMTVLAGSTVLAFVTEYNINGNPPGSGPPDPITVDDNAGGAYALLQTQTDSFEWQTVMAFVRTTTTPVATLTGHAHFAGLEWQGIVVAEIVGVHLPILTSASQFQVLPGATVDSASSGPMTYPGPALLVGFDCSTQANQNPPSIGTGFTLVGNAWNWGGAEGTANLPSATLEYRQVDAGNAAATFTPAGADREATFGIALPE